ncbi:predicted protein [Coccidioides posadasii str. Silveira]|uniref:Predicted protein n=2 Tax=Coccidioides posadasii TaxID=199306 RepID=E9DFT8_COCPS|nr:predicted protein [Coccidioides posadasii str. Silveira]KMM63739.1 hypothetical protein CPAG_00093 [Coccidioides posadasii RMSCC 3488]
MSCGAGVAKRQALFCSGIQIFPIALDASSAGEFSRRIWEWGESVRCSSENSICPELKVGTLISFEETDHIWRESEHVQGMADERSTGSSFDWSDQGPGAET